MGRRLTGNDPGFKYYEAMFQLYGLTNTDPGVITSYDKSFSFSHVGGGLIAINGMPPICELDKVKVISVFGPAAAMQADIFSYKHDGASPMALVWTSNVVGSYTGYFANPSYSPDYPSYGPQYVGPAAFPMLYQTSIGVPYVNYDVNDLHDDRRDYSVNTMYFKLTVDTVDPDSIILVQIGAYALI